MISVNLHGLLPDPPTLTLMYVVHTHTHHTFSLTQALPQLCTLAKSYGEAWDQGSPNPMSDAVVLSKCHTLLSMWHLLRYLNYIVHICLLGYDV